MESELQRLIKLVEDLIEKVIELENTVEELNEKVGDLQLTTNGGFSIERYDE